MIKHAKQPVISAYRNSNESFHSVSKLNISVISDHNQNGPKKDQHTQQDLPKNGLDEYGNKAMLSTNMENENCESFIEDGLREYYSRKKHHFMQRVSKGPPNSIRWITWLIVNGIPDSRSEDVLLSLLMRPLDLEMETVIRKDLNRTFPLSLKNVEGAEQNLFNVLKCFACHDTEISYCQGMNFITGFLLILSDYNENETLYLMLSLFSETFNNEGASIRGFYCEEFPLLKLYLYQFDFIFMKKLPNLKKHFDTLNVPNEVWIGRWIMTLFTICLPVEFCVRLWDCIFCYGLGFMFNFSIALLKELETTLIKIEEAIDVLDYFRGMQPFTKNNKITEKLDLEDLIASAKKVDISKSLLNSLKADYEQKFNVNFAHLKIKYDMKSFDGMSLRSVSRFESSIDYSVRHEDFVLFEESNNFKMDREVKSMMYNSNNNFNTEESKIIFEIYDENDDEVAEEVCEEFTRNELAIKMRQYNFNYNLIKIDFSEDEGTFERSNTYAVAPKGNKLSLKQTNHKRSNSIFFK